MKRIIRIIFPLITQATFILIYLLSFNKINAQVSGTDKYLIQNSDFKDASYEYKREVKFMHFKSQNFFAKYNPFSLTAGALMFVYQKGISAQFATNCPYAVSCSEFSKVAIQRYGLLKGIFLSADRLSRCSRMALNDLHPFFDFDQKSHKIIDAIEYYR